jgi:hypothetical protein
MNTKRELMILDWTRKVHQLEYAHCFESIMYSYLNSFLNIGALIIMIIVSFCYQFPEMPKEDYDKLFILWKLEYFVPIFSLIAALFTIITTFVRPGEKAENHRKLGLEYEKIRHEFEKVYTYNLTETSIEFKANQVKERWDNMSTKYVTQYNYNRARKFVKKFDYPEPMSFIK